MKRRLKVIAGCAVLLVKAWLGFASGPTNTLALYLVLVPDEVPYQSIVDGTAAPDSFKLQWPPLISDKDFVAYNPTNHAFVLVPEAGERVADFCRLNPPFVLVARGEPIYLGVFRHWTSSQWSGVPTILVDECWDRPVRTNITLRIARGWPTDEFGRGLDHRSDKRAISAVQRLFPDAKYAR